MKGANYPWVEIGPSGKNDNSPQIGFFNCQGSKFGRPDLKNPGGREPEISWSARSDPVIYILLDSAPYLKTCIL